MSKTLKLGDTLALPLSAVTETFGILAARGAGKSNLAAVLAEQMFDAGLPFVVVDPVGSWYGLRAGADGQKNGGLAIPIFGGKHGDVPLERGGGELLADLVVSKRLSCVLDLSAFESEGAKKAFLLAFAQRLYLKNTDPLHLFLEEADDYIPQRPMRDEAQLLRAWENIVRRGRSRGLGMTLITQRSASINKSVLTQVQTLFVLRTTGPQDRAAIEAWVKYHDSDDKVLSSLSGLGPGEGWVWSPQFLERMSKHQFNRRRTFDSGATPKNLRGKDARAAATLADVDLPEIHAQMAATIERAKADDPKELKKQIAKLMATIAEQHKALERAQVSAGKGNDVPVLTESDHKRLEQTASAMSAASVHMNEGLVLAGQRFRSHLEIAIGEYADLVQSAVTKAEKSIATDLNKVTLQRVLETLERVAVPAKNGQDLARSLPNRESLQNRPVFDDSRKNPNKSGGQTRSLDSRPAEGLTGAEQRIVNSVGWWTVAGIEAPSRHQVAFVAGYTVNGHFNNLVGGLRTKGLIDYPPGGGIFLTGSGGALAKVEHKPTFTELIERVLKVLEPSPGRIFKAVVEAGRDLTREELAQLTGYTVNGHFNNMVGSLRSLGIIQYPRQGGVRLGEMFEALLGR